MSLYEIHDEISVDEPVLVLALEGWIDSGFAGAAAYSALMASVPTEVVATFDIDTLLDFRSRRPTQSIDDGVLTKLTWAELHLRQGTSADGTDLLVLAGPEPDHHWRTFTAEIVDLARQLNVSLALGMGAFPAAVPHTRPTRIVATANTEALAKRIGNIPGLREVPSGINAALVKAFGEAGIEAASLWAMVPHYIQAMPYPQASLALLDRFSDLTGITVDTTDLGSAATLSRQRIDELIAQSSEHVEMVLALETQVDEAARQERDGLTISDLPSGDEIAAELERFLREHPPE